MGGLRCTVIVCVFVYLVFCYFRFVVGCAAWLLLIWFASIWMGLLVCNLICVWDWCACVLELG